MNITTQTEILMLLDNLSFEHASLYIENLYNCISPDELDALFEYFTEDKAELKNTYYCEECGLDCDYEKTSINDGPYDWWGEQVYQVYYENLSSCCNATVYKDYTLTDSL